MVLVLLLSTGAFFATLQRAHDPALGARTGSLLTNALWSGVYVTTFLLLRSRCRNSMAAFKDARLLLLLIGIALASVLWSDARTISLLRGAALAGTSLLGLYLAARFDLKQQLVLLGWTFGVAATLSAVVALAIPSVGVGAGEFEGNWLGIYPHKNLLGINMAIGFVVFLVLSQCHPTHRWLLRLGAGLCLALVLLSNSASALVSCVVVFSVFLFFRVLRSGPCRSMCGRVLVCTIAIGSLFLLVSHFEGVTNALDRDTALTGRTALWYLVWAAIMERPYFGYGYYGFWRGYEGPSGDVWNAFGQEMFYSHNGFLEVWLDLGLLGLVIFILGFLRYTTGALATFLETGAPERSWPLLFLVLMLVSNLAEGSILRTNTVSWILYTAAAFLLCADGGKNAGGM